MTSIVVGCTDRPSVRMPIRILAALVLICQVVAAAGSAYIYLRAGDSLNVQLRYVAMIPLELWFMRVMWYAMRTGSSPKQLTTWPFATQRLFEIYGLVCVLLWLRH